MKKLRKSLPGLKATVLTVAGSLAFAALASGGKNTLLGLVFAVCLLALLTLRNYDPDTFQAHVDPSGHFYRTQRDELYTHLSKLTQAVEVDERIDPLSAASIKAADARVLLDSYKSKARR
jgi:hypothetical protein